MDALLMIAGAGLSLVFVVAVAFHGNSAGPPRPPLSREPPDLPRPRLVPPAPEPAAPPPTYRDSAQPARDLVCPHCGGVAGRVR